MAATTEPARTAKPKLKPELRAVAAPEGVAEPCEAEAEAEPASSETVCEVSMVEGMDSVTSDAFHGQHRQRTTKVGTATVVDGLAEGGRSNSLVGLPSLVVNPEG
jgi:hypothetical protein